MSDLISRSKVISVLEQLEEHSLTGKMDISNAIYLLKIQPKAYDIDKIVEELDMARTNNNGLKFELIPFDKVVEIVKQGGVEKDVG